MVVRILLLSRRHTAACHTRTTTLQNHAHNLPNMAHTKGALPCATVAVAVRWFCRESIFDEKSLVQCGENLQYSATHTRHTQNKGVCCHMGHEACEWQVPAKKRAFPMVKTFSICYLAPPLLKEYITQSTEQGIYSISRFPLSHVETM